MTDIKLCPAISSSGTHCEEIKGHTPLELWGRKFDHAAHTQGIAWNEVPGDAAARSWETELLAELPAHTYVETRNGAWTATWSHPAGGWAVYRYPRERVVIRGQNVKVETNGAAVRTVVNTLRLHGALDDPAITGVSWEARRWLANELHAYTLACAKRLGRDITTHDESHINGMSAGVSWLRGELSAPPEPAKAAEPRREAVVMAELVRDAWHLIATAHGGQPWTAGGAWRDNATEWRDAYRHNNISAELVEEARSLIWSVEGGNWDDAPLEWQGPAIAWRGRYIAWHEARS